VLKTFPAFVDLSTAELAVLSAIVRERFFERGTALLTPGKPVPAFYLIFEGEVQTYKDGNPTQRFGPRSAVGSLAALTRDPMGAHVVALEDTLALEVDPEDMDDVFEDHFNILSAVLRTIASLMRDLQIQLGGGAAIKSEGMISGVNTREPLGVVERMLVLRQATNFAHVSIEALAELANDAEELRYSAGQRLWEVGQRGNWSLMVAAGEVECRPPNGEPFFFGPRFVVGGLDSLAEQPRWYEAVAKSDLVGLRQTRSSLMDAIEDYPEMAMDMLRNLASGLLALQQRLAQNESS